MSPPDAESRPKAAPSQVVQMVTPATESIVTRAWEKHPQVASQLRRRRSASRRLRELDDGRRDPIDRPRPRTPVTVRAVGPRSVEFDGPGVVEAIRTIGCKSMRSRFGGGWLVPETAAEDVLALIEYRGFAVQVTL